LAGHSINAGALQGRVSDQLFERLEEWRRCQPKIPSRAEALRALVERALAAEGKGTAARREAAA
jgi:hypothetical protein